jgi:aminoglycoside 3-N-acetyltransferase
MSESKVVLNTSLPSTRDSLRRDLIRLGLQPHMVLLSHSSLSSLGWVCGGTVSVIQALMDVLTPMGTLIMPAQSTSYSDPLEWEEPPVPEDWWPIIRANMPAFDPYCTPSDGVGKIAENFRNWPDALRSNHPSVSFAAWGQQAAVITINHGLENSLGENSPLARLYELDAQVLLLGVDYDQSTCFHLSEYRAIHQQQVTMGAPILVEGQRHWQEYVDIEFDTERFGEIGLDFEQSYPVATSLVGNAQAKLFSLRQAVDFGVKWLNH